MRTSNWYLPRGQAEYSSLDKFLFRYLPFYMKSHRYKIASQLEINSALFPLKFSAFRHYIEEGALQHVRDTAPAEYLDLLTPQYPLGLSISIATQVMSFSYSYLLLHFA